MIYYKKLPFDNYRLLTEQGLSYVKTREDILTKKAGVNLIYAGHRAELIEHIPSLDLFSQFGLCVTSVMFYVMYNDLQSGIHSDSWPREARINIPILNCEGSRIEFWDGVIYEDRINPRGVAVKVGVSGTGEFKDSVELDMPTVILVNVPHRSYVGPNTPRITMSLDFDKCPSFLLNQ